MPHPESPEYAHDWKYDERRYNVRSMQFLLGYEVEDGDESGTDEAPAENTAGQNKSLFSSGKGSFNALI
jgi:hypothetical protein